MALSSDHRAAIESAKAFDGVAAEYHRTNSANPILAHMRSRAVSMLRRHVGAGAELVDLGCGPGTDHPALLTAGYCVTAIDAAPEMVRQAQRRAAEAAGPRPPRILHRSIEDLHLFGPHSFDAAFSNFGPLNCVRDLADAARQIHDVLRPGGLLVASVIGRVCPWEIALYLSKGRARRAFTRFSAGRLGVPLKGGTVWTRYVSPGQFERVFGRVGFARVELSALGVIAPPPYLDAFAARRPSLVARLLALDDAIGGLPLVRSLGDHFLIALRRA